MPRSKNDIVGDGTIEIRTRIPRVRRLKVTFNKPPGKGPEHYIPCFRFSAMWLADLGFNIGSYFLMQIEDDNSIRLIPNADISEECVDESHNPTE